VGYPELGSAPGPFEIARHWGVIDNCLDPTREEVYTFLDAFLGEMAALFPDPYFHIGGDEVNGKQWKANARIQEFMRARKMATQHDLQAYFNQRVLTILRKHGKKMLGWDEILHPGLPRDIIVHSWRGQKSLAQAATQGYQGILSWGYYLDLMQHAADHYAVDPLARETAGLTAEEQRRVLGGEACMWAEYITAENVENRVWPRAAAVAERLWSPAAVTNVNSMYQRLEAVSR
jgi:hexosaminidase